MKKKSNILILFGGGKAEHEVSRVSADYLNTVIGNVQEFNPILVEINKNGVWLSNDRPCSLVGKVLKTPTEQPYIDYIIPCFHGYPGETGDIQGLFENHQIPYFGQNAEASVICFNKVLTKLFLDHMGVKNTPWMSVHKNIEIDESKIRSFFKEHQSDVFIKAASQGSSVGCFHVTDELKLIDKINEAFKFSDHVLIEKSIKGRELEISVFEFEGKVMASLPGEIKCSGDFYDYEEKYSDKSTTSTDIIAKNISSETMEEMRDIAKKVFTFFGLRHLSRVDFFLTEKEVLLNEINTFPGMTPISMFPKMLEKELETQNYKFSDYITAIIKKTLNKEGSND